MKKIFYQSVLTVITIALIFFAPGRCSAQSVLGKWKRNLLHVFSFDTSTGKKVIVSDEYQKQYDVATAENAYNEILEMKSDNTFISTVTAGGKQTVHSGKYSISGNILDMNIPLVKGQKSTITIVTLTPATMVWNLVFMGKSNGIQYDKM